MAASGFTPIQLYRSATPGAAPTAGNLAAGELALNTADEKLFFKNAAGSVVAFSGGFTYTDVKTANYTAKAGEGVLTSTAGGAFTVTLPATPATGVQVVVADAGGAWGTNNLTIGRNGTTIEGVASDLICNISNVSVTLVYSGTTWQVFAQAGGAGGVIDINSQTTGTLTVARGGTGVTTSTGTGSVVLSATPTFTGQPFFDASVRSNIVALGSSAVDCNAGNFFTRTVSGATSWTISNVPSSRAYSFLLELTNGGTGTQTWFTNTRWPGGTAPTLTTSGVDVLGFITDDGGANWRGVALMLDSK